MAKRAYGLVILGVFLGCGNLYGQNGDPAVPSEPTPLRSLRTGTDCFGNRNGVGSWHSSFCESLKCEKRKCVSMCAGPQAQSVAEGCQVSY